VSRVRQRVESAVPELRENPFPWERHKTRRNVLVRRSDVGELLQVQFVEARDATKFLVGLAEKHATQAGMTPTQVQREKLRRGLERW
jgi:hypothetical protein